MKRISTTREAMEVLGGTAAVSRLTGVPYKRVWDWSGEDRFPAKYFLVMWTELVRREHFAPPALWGQAETSREMVTLLRTSIEKNGVAA